MLYKWFYSICFATYVIIVDVLPTDGRKGGKSRFLDTPEEIAEYNCNK